MLLIFVYKKDITQDRLKGLNSKDNVKTFESQYCYAKFQFRAIPFKRDISNVVRTILVGLNLNREN